MFKYASLLLIVLIGAGSAAAQLTHPTSDVLGAHLNYGRGCSACHSPHSGPAGNGNAAQNEIGATSSPLWGEGAAGLYGKTIVTDGGKFVEVLPTSLSAETPDAAGMLTCLTCHDGNYASVATMKNRIYENLPPTYGNHNSIPTLLGSNGSTGYLGDHPMGLSARISCGGSSGWDCADVNGSIVMNGSASSRFVSNYGFFVKPGKYNNTAVVVCTTCHDPHSMNVVNIGSDSTSGLPRGTYATAFFLRAPYNPNDTNPLSNQTAQFCRQCHADKSNEMYGGATATVF